MARTSYSTFTRISTAGIGLALAAVLAACSSSSSAVDSTPSMSDGPDLTAANIDERVRIDPVPQAVQALEDSSFEPIQDGKLTVAHASAAPPLAFLAEDDNVSILGIEPDIAQLVADGLGLELASENVSWPDWPLGVESGKYDAAITNVTVTEERKELFDFATYRDDSVAFSVRKDSDIQKIEQAEDVAGLKVAVTSGTNQEKILLDWFAENEANGLEAGEPVYFDDVAASHLALLSGRIDAVFSPNPIMTHLGTTSGESHVVGLVNGGFPETAEIGVTTAKDNGLIEPVALVLEHVIESGEYQEVLDRWDLGDEAVTETRINPPGLPKP